MSITSVPSKIVIVGGGFGGVRCALELEKLGLGSSVTLISDRPHFEYHPALYRVVTGRSPLEVCIPLREIFEGKKTRIVHDVIGSIDLKAKQIIGSSGSKYAYDYLVLALGSETLYFNIPGLNQFSFGFKSITEALSLKRHIHKLFEDTKVSNADKDDDVRRMHFVVVGGGPSGVELAADLAVYTKKLAQSHKVDPGLITVDLIEASPRLIPSMPESFSQAIKMRLHRLGINVFLNRTVTSENADEVFLKDMQLKSSTIIWTAGAKPNNIFEKTPGLSLNKKGNVEVTESLEAKGNQNVFVVGDAAATPFTGMAQTALLDAVFVAQVISARRTGRPLPTYKPQKPVYAIPVGPGWGAVLLGSFAVYGSIGWLLRRAADLRFFLTILPLSKALRAFQSGKTLCESCEICSVEPSVNPQ